MIKISMAKGIVATAAMMAFSCATLADGPMTPSSAPTPASDRQMQKVRKQQLQSQQSQKPNQQDPDSLSDLPRDRQQYEQPEHVRRDIPEPDNLFDD